MRTHGNEQAFNILRERDSDLNEGKDCVMPYCIPLRSRTDTRITGWYVGTHYGWSTDRKRQKRFDNKRDAAPVCDKLRSLCPRNARFINIEAAQDDLSVHTTARGGQDRGGDARGLTILAQIAALLALSGCGPQSMINRPVRSSALINRSNRPSPRAWARSMNRREARL